MGSQAVRIVDAHGRPKPVDGLLKHAERSGLKCRSQTSTAREGSRPPWVQIPPLPPFTSQDAAPTEPSPPGLKLGELFGIGAEEPVLRREGVPLLWVRRISLDTTARVVEISDAQYPADRTKLTFHTPLTRWDVNC